MNRIKTPIIVTKNAWSKLNNIFVENNNYAFLFSAKGGGCNGFNYDLKPISKDIFNNIKNEHSIPSIMINNNTKLLIDPVSEFLLLGTTIDYIKEDYNKNIFESKFIFTPDKELATSNIVVPVLPENIAL